MSSTSLMVSCLSSSFLCLQTDGKKVLGPLPGSVEWAEKELVARGIVKRRVKLKRLSAKKIAEIIERLSEAEDWRDDHRCDDYY